MTNLTPVFGRVKTIKRATKFSRIDADKRRQSLIEATERCLIRDGIEGATVRRICEEAGVSAGLLRHYFEGKEDLVGQTYDAMAGKFAHITHHTLKTETMLPEERLQSFFEASFSPDFIKADVLMAWTAFWRLNRSNALIQEQHRDVYAAYRQDLEDVLSEIAKDRDIKIDARLAALSLTGIMDGLWLELCLDPTSFTPEEAIDVCRNWLESYKGTNHIGRFDTTS